MGVEFAYVVAMVAGLLSCILIIASVSVMVDQNYNSSDLDKVIMMGIMVLFIWAISLGIVAVDKKIIKAEPDCSGLYSEDVER